MMTAERGTPAKYHPLYGRWAHMRQMCYNPDSPDYAKFGGRGIKISSEFDRFWDFADLIEEKLGIPDDLSYLTKLSRKDLNGDFTIKNMCWDTAKQVGRRHDKVYTLKYKGVSKPLKQWCEELDINFHTLHNRVKLGWTPAQCLGYKLGPRYSEIARKKRK